MVCKNKTKAFTLIELLVVIAIIGILTTLVSISIANVRSRATDLKSLADIKAMKTAIDTYYIDEHSYPATLTPGQAIVGSSSSSTYLAVMPSANGYSNINGCYISNYSYGQITSKKYFINFCLNNENGDMSSGCHALTNEGTKDFCYPPVLAGLKLWLSGPGGDFKTRVSGNDTFIKEWKDPRDETYMLSQIIEGSQPKLVTGFNNKPMVYFNGTSYLDNIGILTAANFPTNNATLFVVYGLNGTQNQYGVLMNANIGTWWSYNGGQGYFGPFCQGRLSGYPTPMPTTGNHVIEVKAGTNYDVILDGVSQGTQAYTWDLGSTLTLGKTDPIGLDGYVAEVFLYNRILSSAEEQTITDYLNVKYNLGYSDTEEFILTYTAGANGSITGVSPQTISSGNNGSAVTAVGAAGYSFSHWSDGSTANPRTDTNVTGNISVTANFIDTDVFNFINTVATLTDGQESIINTLVTDLKTAGLWTKMDIIYPFIGGTATTHSYNLKAPADYQITWNGVWTHDANGAVSNGAAASYGATGWNPLTLSKNINDFHLSFYNRNGASETDVGGRGSFGWYIANTGFGLLSNRAGYGIMSIIGSDVTWAKKTTIPLNGLITGSRISSTDNRAYQNNTQQAISTSTNSHNFANHSVEIGRLTAAIGSTQPFAFASVGTGLTSTDVSNLYTIIQAYQTSLGRQTP